MSMRRSSRLEHSPSRKQVVPSTQPARSRSRSRSPRKVKETLVNAKDQLERKRVLAQLDQMLSTDDLHAVLDIQRAYQTDVEAWQAATRGLVTPDRLTVAEKRKYAYPWKGVGGMFDRASKTWKMVGRAPTSPFAELVSQQVAHTEGHGSDDDDDNDDDDGDDKSAGDAATAKAKVVNDQQAVADMFATVGQGEIVNKFLSSKISNLIKTMALNGWDATAQKFVKDWYDYMKWTDQTVSEKKWPFLFQDASLSPNVESDWDKVRAKLMAFRTDGSVIRESPLLPFLIKVQKGTIPSNFASLADKKQATLLGSLYACYLADSMMTYYRIQL
jgi:hypothetical protein